MSAGTSIVTDPVLERRIGLGRGVAKLGPRRLIQPALRKRELPRLDAVLLSHAHMDHTDLGTLRAIPAEDAGRRPVGESRSGPPVPRGRRARLGRDHPRSATWRWSPIETRHWGARMVTDRHRGWGGYLLRKAGRTVLFAGDTAYTDVLSRHSASAARSISPSCRSARTTRG